MKELNILVKQMLEEHKGGEKFFDNLDNHLRYNTDILNHFYRNYIESYTIAYDFGDIDGVILTGRFGRMFANYLSCIGVAVDVVIVNGGLRKGEPIDNFERWIDADGSYIIIDDSYYSGKTVNTITKKVEEYGAEVSGVYVIYDGSKEKNPLVTSMYRYYEEVAK